MTAAVTDDELCLQVADGHKWSLIVAALTKRTLQNPGIKPADRLDILERLNGLTDGYFTADLLATIESICDTGYAIFHEARTLDPPQDDTHCAASFKYWQRRQCSDISSVQSVNARRDQIPRSVPASTARGAAAGRNCAAAPASGNGRHPLCRNARRTNGVTQHRSHYPPNQINRMGGGLPESE